MRDIIIMAESVLALYDAIDKALTPDVLRVMPEAEYQRLIQAMTHIEQEIGLRIGVRGGTAYEPLR